MRKMKKLMLFAVELVVAFDAWSATETVGGYTWTYRINGDTAEVYNGDHGYPITAISPTPKGALTIPSALGGKPVTCIGDYALSYCRELTNVTIPNGVTRIGDYAFYNCECLPRVTIPNTVASIGEDAFSACCTLISVMIPDSVTSIGAHAFYDSGLKKVMIGKGMMSCGDFAFGYCSGLTNVTISAGVTSLGNSMFHNCINLTSVAIPDSVISIGDNAFAGCGNLATVTIGKGVKNIGNYAFIGCSKLTIVSFLGDVPMCGSDIYASTPLLALTNSVTGAWTGATDMWQERPVMVVADATATVGGKSITVSGAWMLAHYDVATVVDCGANDILSSTAANGMRSVAECFALGIDPENPSDDFRITRFWMDGDVPMFEFSHTTDGSGNTFIPRIRKMGATTPTGPWTEVPAAGNPTYRFFKAEVVLP